LTSSGESAAVVVKATWPSSLTLLGVVKGNTAKIP
jgi:hypothetical protein